jgi:hypothetical protein
MHEYTQAITDTVDVPANSSLNLNGATINFNLTTTVPGFSAQGDNIEIYNGTINVVGTTMGGNGQSLAPITSGSQATGVGFKNLSYHDLTLSTNRNDAGAAISILGSCNDVEIYNITIPDNANSRNVIGLEWGGTPVPDGTGHPHNIRVDNIRCGKLTFPSSGPGGFGFVVWASAAFNISVSNLFLEQGYGLMMAIAGDNGNEFAPASYKEMVGTGITLNNASCPLVFGYAVRAIGKSDGTTEESVLYTNITATADPAATANTFGMQTEFSRGTKLKGFKFNNFTGGYATGSDTRSPVIEDGEIRGSELYGMQLGSSGVPTLTPKVRNVHLAENNADGGTGISTAAITLVQCVRPDIRGCTFGDEGSTTETQKHSITCTVDTIAPRLNNNHTNDLIAGGTSYVIGSSTQPQINANGSNNTSESALSNVGGAPIFTLETDGSRTFHSGTIPTSGAYNRGDRLYFPSPAAAGFIGAVCVTGGSPGTWKNFGSIVA